MVFEAQFTCASIHDEEPNFTRLSWSKEAIRMEVEQYLSTHFLN